MIFHLDLSKNIINSIYIYKPKTKQVNLVLKK